MAHHGDDVCGGSCVGCRQNFCTIPTVQILQSGSFLFLPEPLEQSSLKLGMAYQTTLIHSGAISSPVMVQLT
jgi:hypothetical protein